MKKAIIIGATSGIGKGLAKHLADNNYKIGLTGRRVELLNELKNENPNFYIKSFDINDTNVVGQKLDELTTELGGLDLLIISSGIGDINESLDFEIEKRTIDTNVLGCSSPLIDQTRSDKVKLINFKSNNYEYKKINIRRKSKDCSGSRTNWLYRNILEV